MTKVITRTEHERRMEALIAEYNERQAKQNKVIATLVAVMQEVCNRTDAVDRRTAHLDMR